MDWYWPIFHDNIESDRCIFSEVYIQNRFTYFILRIRVRCRYDLSLDFDIPFFFTRQHSNISRLDQKESCASLFQTGQIKNFHLIDSVCNDVISLVLYQVYIRCKKYISIRAFNCTWEEEMQRILKEKMLMSECKNATNK